MNGRSLRALINQREVGHLREVAGLWSFQYAASWLNHPQAFALSPHLPLERRALAGRCQSAPGAVVL
jgi:serine/threonine-protein kinase HipA